MGDPIIEGPDLLSLGGSLLIVIGAVILLGWLYSRLRFNSGGPDNLINIVGSRALGPKERIMLIEVGGQNLLVGMTATHVQTLHKFDEPVAVAPEKKPSGFASRLRNAVNEAAS